MRRHPLRDVLDEIDPAEQYTVKDIANLTGRSRNTVGRWAAGGHLGEGEREPCGAYDAAARRVWTGLQLLSAIEAPRPVQDHDGRSPLTTWAKGCRAGDGCTCHTEHNTETSTLRRKSTEETFPRGTRARVLRWLRQGKSPEWVSQEMGISTQRIWSYARMHPEFGRALDEALTAGRDPSVPHGVEYTYTVRKCRCPDCRRAKARSRGGRKKQHLPPRPPSL